MGIGREDGDGRGEEGGMNWMADGGEGVRVRGWACLLLDLLPSQCSSVAMLEYM